MDTLTWNIVFWFALIPSALEAPIPGKTIGSQVQEQQAAASNADAKGQQNQNNTISITIGKNGQPEGEREKCAGQSEDESPSYQWWAWFNATVVTAFTLILMIATGLQAWHMRRQTDIIRDEMKATQAAADAARDTVKEMQIDRRPWLGVIGPTLGVPLAPGNELRYTMPVKNAGKTPGFITHGTFTAAKCLPGAVDAHLVQVDFLPLEERNTLVMPEGNVLLRVITPLEITASDIASVAASQLILIITGRFVYRDTTSAIHHTKCCYVYEASTGELHLSDKYNEMD